MANDISYLAGLLDGEGCFIINKDDSRGLYLVRMQITSTHKPVTEWLQRIFKGKVYLQHGATESMEATYVWMLQQKPLIRELLLVVLPELKIKKLQAWLLLNFCEEFSIGSGRVYSQPQRDRMDKFCKLLHLANSRGPGSADIKAKIFDFYTVGEGAK